MFIPYVASVVILSLALYGLWHVLRDLWAAFLAAELEKAAGASLLVVVRDGERWIEGALRCLLQEVTGNPFWCDVVVVDYGSQDLTPGILDRLAAYYPLLNVVHLPPDARPVAEGFALCQGGLVYVLDFANRIRFEDASPVIQATVRRQ